MSNFPVSHLFNRLLQGEFKIFGLSFHTSQRLSEILWIPTIPLLCIYRLTLSQILFAVNHLFPNKRKDLYLQNISYFIEKIHVVFFWQL
jgi:hypothetical protein